MGQIFNETEFKNKPLVSVIVPAYNIEDYIGKCVESIIGQSYEKLEIILVDDGADDETPKICDGLAQKDNRIRVIHQSNGGLSKARNVGIEQSRGDFLYFVDGDDMIHKECIKNLVRIAQQEKCDIVQCKTYEFIHENKIPGVLPEEKLEWVTGKKMCMHLVYGTLGSDTTVVWNKLYKRNLFDNTTFPEGMLYEDIAVMHRLYWDAQKVVITNLPLAFYRSMRQGSITHSGNKKYEDRIKAGAMWVRFFKEQSETALYEQSAYLLVNGFTRLRIYRDRKNRRYREEQKEYVDIVMHSGLPVYKKFIAQLGFVVPSVWFWIWEKRRALKEKREWKAKGEIVK